MIQEKVTLRLDAIDPINTLIDDISEKFFGQLDLDRLETVIRQFAERTSSWQREQLREQIIAAVGIDLMHLEPNIASVIQAFVAENVALIKSVPNRLFDDVERTITSGVREGLTTREVGRQLSDKLGVSEKRARLIARDQIAKLNGELNQVRQENLGIDAYIWQSMNDARVRPEHRARQGQRFTWDKPPRDGHPGRPVNCRCYAEPDFTKLLRG